MKKFIPLLIAGGAAVWYLLRMRNLSTNLIFIIRNIKIKGGSVLQPNIEISIGVQNPVSVSAKLKSLIGEISIDDKIIANFSNFTPITIQGNTETIINVIATPNIIGVFNVIKDVIIKRQKGKVIKVKGTANVNNLSLPFVSTYSF